MHAEVNLPGWAVMFFNFRSGGGYLDFYKGLEGVVARLRFFFLQVLG
jgi:hypothetical protein